ncbi:MAG: extracellular solute-binding protein, partial [Synergistaceae bacterium]|nr:extracellular solute-binding protein [Synergistaceae bacterium]
MFKWLKKFVIVSLAGVLFTACGIGTAAAASGGKTVIEYWHVNAETQGGLAVDELVKAFNAQSGTVEVIARYNPDMYKGLMQNLQAEAATGRSPAIVQVGWAFLDYFSNNFGYVYPQAVIDAFFPEDKNFIADNFLPNIIDLARNSSGNLVGLAYSLSNPVLFINRDILRQSGLPEDGPKTWEEVRSFSRTVRERTGKYGLYIQEPADTWAQQALIESNGAKMITARNGTSLATVASDEAIKAFEFYADMVLKDKTA